MITEDVTWLRVSSLGTLQTLRQIVVWRWGHIIVDEEPTRRELNSDDGYDVGAAHPISCDFSEGESIFGPSDPTTNRITRGLEDLEAICAVLSERGWREAERVTTMWGHLQSTECRWSAEPEYSFLSTIHNDSW